MSPFETMVMICPEGFAVFLRRKGSKGWALQSTLTTRREADRFAIDLLAIHDCCERWLPVGRLAACN
jgi:hypothetical protein